MTTSTSTLDLFIDSCFQKDGKRRFYGFFKTTEQKNRTVLWMSLPRFNIRPVHFLPAEEGKKIVGDKKTEY